MRYEEAIKDLKQMKQNYLDMDINYGLVQSLNLAIEALEKQIPKKPVWEHLGDSLSNADIITMCPCCYKGIEEDEHHCECGQAIDWSE